MEKKELHLPGVPIGPCAKAQTHGLILRVPKMWQNEKKNYRPPKKKKKKNHYKLCRMIANILDMIIITK
jgi:hypothetical protein